MERLLRFFRRFRDLEAQVVQAAALIEDRDQEAQRLRDSLAVERDKVIRTEAALSGVRDEIAFLRGRVEHWETKYEEAVKQGRIATETIADFESMRLHGRQIFGHVPAAPMPKIDPSAMRPAVTHPRMATNRIEEKNMREARERVKQFYEQQKHSAAN